MCINPVGDGANLVLTVLLIKIDTFFQAVLYISDILVNPAVCEIVCDILHDFMVINGLERGKDAIRVQVAADSLLASSLAGEDDYRLAGHIGDIVYYEADTKSFC